MKRTCLGCHSGRDFWGDRALLLAAAMSATEAGVVKGWRVGMVKGRAIAFVSMLGGDRPSQPQSYGRDLHSAFRQNLVLLFAVQGSSKNTAGDT